jgi:cation:H+ antiporter
MEHLIPKEWFTGLPQWALILVSVVAIAALIKAADMLVDGATGIAYKMGISKVIVGATIVSLGTTSPEFGVSVMAAWSGEAGLALGNAIGSVIADTGLIFGIGCLMTILPADRFVLIRQGWVQFGAAVLLAALCYGAFIISGDQATLGRWVGIFLLLLLVVYMVISIRWSKQHPTPEESGQEAGEEGSGTSSGRAVPLLVTLGLFGLVIVIGSSRLLILSVTELAEVHWHIPKVVIAATLVALGTSLPELVIGLTSILKGHKELLVGNVIGADILNVLFVVGGAAAAAPLPIIEPTASIPNIALYLHIPTMLLILVLFRIFIQSAARTGSFKRWQGVPLVLIYLAYTIVQFVIV